MVQDERRPPLHSGDRLGDYQVLRSLGAGGQAAVYEAEHAETGRRVALKVPHPGSACAVLEAAARVRDVDSPHLVRVEAAERGSDPPFVVLELHPRGDLESEILRSPEGLPLGRVAEVGLGILEALADLHRAGVEHGDVKPRNVLLGRDGRPLVTDAGAGASPGTLRHSVDRTRLGAIGTASYTAPEHLPGVAVEAEEPDCGFRSDLFGVGKVLFRMLTGRSAEAFRAPSFYRPGLDPRWDALVLRLAEERPEDRFPTADAAAEALREVAGRPRRRGSSSGLRAAAQRPAQILFRSLGLVALVQASLAAALGGWAVLGEVGAEARLALLGAAVSQAVAILVLSPLVAALRRVGAPAMRTAQAWIGVDLALAALSASAVLARLHGPGGQAAIGWSAASFASVLGVAWALGLVADAAREAAPPTPIDGRTAVLESWLRLPTQCAWPVAVAWLAGIWLELRPANDTPLLTGFLLGAALAWRLAGREVALRTRWPRLTALGGLTCAAAVGAGWAIVLRGVATEPQALRVCAFGALLACPGLVGCVRWAAAGWGRAALAGRRGGG